MADLVVERFFDSGKIDFTIQLTTLSIICFKVAQVDFPNKCVFQSLYIAFIIANMQTLMKCSKLQNYPFRGFQYTTGVSDKFNRVMPLGLKPLGLEL